MFRNRFDDVFARSLPSFGPQELEYDLTETVPGSRAEAFLCAVLGLLLNRKQDVKYAARPNLVRSNSNAVLHYPILTNVLLLELDIITVLWRTRLACIRANGPVNGTARVPSRAAAPLPQ